MFHDTQQRNEGLTTRDGANMSLDMTFFPKIMYPSITGLAVLIPHYAPIPKTHTQSHNIDAHRASERAKKTN